jgi:hypothetical protein
MAKALRPLTATDHAPPVGRTAGFSSDDLVTLILAVSDGLAVEWFAVRSDHGGGAQSDLDAGCRH